MSFIIARRTAHGARRTAETFGQTAFAAFVIILAGFCALTFADKASAQQPPPSSISYTTEPAGLITITADGEVVVLSQPAAGLMTVTISGIGFTLVGGEYVRTGYTGQDTLTLRFITSCNVREGCDGNAFGLTTGIAQASREGAFRRMSLATLSMFVASGADVNERINNSAGGFLLMRLAIEGRGAAVSLLITAGANINATDSTGNTMLHAVILQPSNLVGDALSVLLAVDGISVNVLNSGGGTPLDFVAGFYGFTRSPAVLEHAETIRNAGGRCINQAANPAAVPVCGVAQQSPNISLPNNANKTFIIRSPNLNTPAVIGNLSTE